MVRWASKQVTINTPVLLYIYSVYSMGYESFSRDSAYGMSGVDRADMVGGVRSTFKHYNASPCYEY